MWSTQSAPPRRAPAADVAAVQRELNGELAASGYPPLVVDGVGGPRTRQAVGAVALMAALRGAPAPHRRVIVDRVTQVLVAADLHGVRLVAPVSTGAPESPTRLVDSVAAFRYEPASDNAGWRNSTTFPVGPDDPRGGNMYRPVYFDRGQAIHGSDRVPPSPSSHGCVLVDPAVQDALVRWLGLDGVVEAVWSTEVIDLRVTVRDGDITLPVRLNGEHEL